MRPRHDGDEQDVFSKRWRRLLACCSRAGYCARVKRRCRRRERRDGRRECKP